MKKNIFIASLIIGVSWSLAILSGYAKKNPIPKVIKSKSIVGEVTFEHQQHFTEFDVKCKSCHHEINAQRLSIPHKEYFDDLYIDCKICHHSTKKPKKAQACSNCHKSISTNPADETLSSKVVIHKNCGNCHELGKGVEASKNCKMCHTGPKSND